MGSGDEGTPGQAGSTDEPSGGGGRVTADAAAGGPEAAPGESAAGSAATDPSLSPPAQPADGAGRPGFPGPADQPGFTGAAGHPGFQGAPGQPGFPGPADQPGVTGAAGHPGFQDAPGYQGAPGHPGPGVPGPFPYPGPQGAFGHPVPAGYPGPWGPPPGWGPPVPPGPGPAGPEPVRTHRWGLGAYLAVEAVFLLASVAVGAVLGDRLSSSAGALALALVVPTLLAAGTAVLITVWRGNGPRIDLGLQLSWRDVGVGLAFGLGGLVITIPASLLYVAIAGDETTSAVGEEFGGIRSGPWMAALVFVIVVFVAPLCEEIVYRGLLWGAVERLGARCWWALVITTVVFALAHFEFTRTPLLLVVAIPIALARLYTGRLGAGIVAHAVNNLLPGISLALMLLGVLPGT